MASSWGGGLCASSRLDTISHVPWVCMGCSHICSSGNWCLYSLHEISSSPLLKRLTSSWASEYSALTTIVPVRAASFFVVKFYVFWNNTKGSNHNIIFIMSGKRILGKLDVSRDGSKSDTLHSTSSGTRSYKGLEAALRRNRTSWSFATACLRGVFSLVEISKIKY